MIPLPPETVTAPFELNAPASAGVDMAIPFGECVVGGHQVLTRIQHGATDIDEAFHIEIEDAETMIITRSEAAMRMLNCSSIDLREGKLISGDDLRAELGIE